MENSENCETHNVRVIRRKGSEDFYLFDFPVLFRCLF
jgi:hypothetical protein